LWLMASEGVLENIFGAKRSSFCPSIHPGNTHLQVHLFSVVFSHSLADFRSAPCLDILLMVSFTTPFHFLPRNHDQLSSTTPAFAPCRRCPCRHPRRRGDPVQLRRGRPCLYGHTSPPRDQEWRNSTSFDR